MLLGSPRLLLVLIERHAAPLLTSTGITKGSSVFSKLRHPEAISG
jgi:hypothetical protein